MEYRQPIGVDFVPLGELSADLEMEEFWLGPGNPGVYYLPPFQAVLAETQEAIRLSDNYAGVLEGKSSLGRAFLIVHTTAGYVDAGWCGGRAAPLTLEIVNLNARRSFPLRPGMAISQITFEQLSSPALHPYGSRGNHYIGSQGVVPSRLHDGYEKFLNRVVPV